MITSVGEFYADVPEKILFDECLKLPFGSEFQEIIL